MASTKKGKSKDLSTPWSDWRWDSAQNTYYQSRHDSSGREEWRYPETVSASDPHTIPRFLDNNITSSTNYYTSTAQSNSPTYGTDTNSSYTTVPVPTASSFENYNNAPISGTVAPSITTHDNYYNSSPSKVPASGYGQDSHDASRPDSSGSMSGSVATLRPPRTPVNSSSYAMATNYITAPGYNTSPEVSGLTVSFQNFGIGSSSNQGRQYTATARGETQRNDDYPATAQNTLDARYKAIDSKNEKKFWKVGRVFLVLWTEPARDGIGVTSQNPGAYSTATTAATRQQVVTTFLGGLAYTEIRRYVIVQEGYGNSICCPIHTYSGDATLKPNLPDAKQHAIIYTSDHPPNEYWYTAVDGTVVRETLTKDPIKVRREQREPEGDLDIRSRINYSKVYTIEHYVRVLNIGVVEAGWIPTLLASSMVSRDSPVERPTRNPPRGSHRDNNSGHRKGEGSSGKKHRRRPKSPTR